MTLSAKMNGHFWLLVFMTRIIEYEAIRTYHDRGMMKWGAFATGELSEAQEKEENGNDNHKE